MRPTPRSPRPTGRSPRPARRGQRPPRRRLVILAALAAFALGALPALAASDAACDEPLAVLSPSGSTGDLSAVAVTAQTLEQGVEGWATVAWETFGDTELTSVTIVGPDDQEVRTDDLASGTAAEVRELRFCGSTEG